MSTLKQIENHSNLNRSGGILLHPTCLPGKYGIGDLGPEAFRWIDFLKKSGCSLWQVLPLGPTGFADSPYQCFSAFAGNTNLINPDLLIKEGLLTQEDINDRPDFPEDQVDFGRVINWKNKVLNQAFDNFESGKASHLQEKITRFRKINSTWVEDYALFMSLKEEYDGAPWVRWPERIRDRNPEELSASIEKYNKRIDNHVFRQFLFSKQWTALREYAHFNGITIIGDAPIFVAHDSSDVWANPDLFYLDSKGYPTVVAGVPPDYFSATGQLWGNPLYRWDVHKKEQFSWWISRLKSVLDMVDLIRLDHFRGFAGYWEVPAGLPTAEKGRWVPGPGADFLQAIKGDLGHLPIIAEDLGEITPDVVELRDSFNLPGMKILQFAFSGDSSNQFLPHNFTNNFAAYTGTHDNDTTLGWFQKSTPKEREYILRYMNLISGNAEEHISNSLIRLLWSSVADFAIAPMQDFLNLDSDARMNFPGRPSGNWRWRMPSTSLKSSLSTQIKELNSTYGRLAE